MFHRYPNDLSTAIEKQDVNKVAKALNQGIDPDSKHGFHPNAPLSTSLDLAVRMNVEIAELLIMRGASIDAKSSNGKTALYGASPACTRLLLEQKANPNTCNEDGTSSTPLEPALLAENVETIKLLLQYKADPKIANHWGKDALTYFMESCVPLFRSRKAAPQIIAELKTLLEGAIAEQEQSAADEQRSSPGLR